MKFKITFGELNGAPTLPTYSRFWSITVTADDFAGAEKQAQANLGWLDTEGEPQDMVDIVKIEYLGGE